MSHTKSYFNIYKQNLDSQSAKEGARATEDKAAAKERTYDEQATAEDVQKNAEGNAPVETKVTNRDKQSAHYGT